MSNRNLFKIAGFVGIITILSKMIGLGRDLVIANVYGTSITADAYNFAYLLTGNALILLGGLGGPFHSATITIITRVKNSAKETGSLLIKIFSGTFLALLLITLIVLFFRNDIVYLIAPANGLSNTYRAELWSEIITQLEIMSPLIIISGLLGIVCGVSNVYGSYFLPSIGPAITSISIIVFVLAFNNPSIGIALALGTTTGAILQLLIQFPPVIKAITNKDIQFAIIKQQAILKEYYVFLGPALLSTSIGQLTVYVDGFFCSGLEEGSWTATIFANRLIQLPLGVLLTAFLVPFFPKFSELANEKKIEDLKKTSIIVIKSLWFLTLPIGAYMFLYANPIIEVLFQRGAFDTRSTNLVSSILIALLISMIAYVARDTLTRVFYSLGNSKIPLYVAILSIMLKIILNWFLVEKYQAAGIAFATSIVTVVNFLLLGFLLKNQIGNLGWMKNLQSVYKMFFATIIIFIIGYGFNRAIDISHYGFIQKFFFLGLTAITCFGTYFAITLMLKVEEAEKIMRVIKTKLITYS